MRERGSSGSLPTRRSMCVFGCGTPVTWVVQRLDPQLGPMRSDPAALSQPVGSTLSCSLSWGTTGVGETSRQWGSALLWSHHLLARTFNSPTHLVSQFCRKITAWSFTFPGVLVVLSTSYRPILLYCWYCQVLPLFFSCTILMLLWSACF